MDFFEYATFSRRLMPRSAPFWASFIVGGVCFAVLFVFQAIALFTIARREGYKHKWMALIPFFNTYYIGHCSQKNKVLNMSAKVVGIIAAVFELIVVGLYILYFVACSYVDANNLEMITEKYTQGFLTIEVTSVNLEGDIPPHLYWAGWCYNYLEENVIWLLNFVFIFMDVMLLSAFFQTYAPNHSFLFALLSIIFPVQGIVMFAVRNNRAVNYREYVRAEQARRYRIYRQNYGGNPYSGTYNQNSYDTRRPPYGNPYGDEFGGERNEAPPEDPFSEFGSDNRRH